MDLSSQLNQKPPFYYRIWFFILLLLGGFFGILITDYAPLLWLVCIILIILRVKWSFRRFKLRRSISDNASEESMSFHDVPDELPPPLSIEEEPVVGLSVRSSAPEVDRIANPQSHKSTTSDSVVTTKSDRQTMINGWNISVSFGKSSSQNYLKAVTLAKAAPQYHEQVDDGHILHQAFYSAEPHDYLAFVMLYELVGGWKSSFVMINGKLVDRKIVGQLNYCYGDRCRSQSNRFCYGASYMTENPFGCHRIQVSACNHPWWSFYRQEGRNRYVLDRSAILERIDSAKSIYELCPCFDYDAILRELYKLPSPLSEREYKALGANGYGLKL